MARPAASSAARLIRRPDESFSMLFDCAYCVACRLRCALNASMLLLTRRDILFLLDGIPATSCHRSGACLRRRRSLLHAVSTDHIRALANRVAPADQDEGSPIARRPGPPPGPRPPALAPP